MLAVWPPVYLLGVDDRVVVVRRVAGGALQEVMPSCWNRTNVVLLHPRSSCAGSNDWQKERFSRLNTRVNFNT